MSDKDTARARLWALLDAHRAVGFGSLVINENESVDPRHVIAWADSHGLTISVRERYCDYESWYVYDRASHYFVFFSNTLGLLDLPAPEPRIPDFTLSAWRSTDIEVTP